MMVSNYYLKYSYLLTCGVMLFYSETNEAVTENTMYGIASVSKHFTATLLGQTLKNTGTKFICISHFKNIFQVLH